MDHYLLSTGSITTAQRMQQVLEQNGIGARIQRLPAGLSKKGCANALRVSAGKYDEAVSILKRLGLSPSAIFAYEIGAYKEVK